MTLTNTQKILAVTGIAVAVAGTALYLAQSGVQPHRRRLRANPSGTRTRSGVRRKRRASKYPGYELQSVLVPKTHRDVRNAAHPKQAAFTVAKRHGAGHPLKIEETRNYYTFRVSDPSDMVKSAYVSLRLPSGTIIRKALPKVAAKRMAA